MKIKKVDIIFIASIGFILVLSFYITSLRIHRLKELRDQAKSISLEVAKGREISSTVRKVKKEIDIIEERSKEFENQLPSRKNIEDFIVQINDIANKSGLIISAIKPQGIIQKNLYGEIPIAINAFASYPEVYNFLYLLKKIPRTNKIESITIKAQETKTNRCDVNMVLKIFVSGKQE